MGRELELVGGGPMDGQTVIPDGNGLFIVEAFDNHHLGHPCTCRHCADQPIHVRRGRYQMVRGALMWMGWFGG